jgi:hypothetical protein
VHLDISTLKPRKPEKGKKPVVVAKPHWRILVDARTQMKWSDFFATKDGMIEPTCQIFHVWKEEKRPVTHLRMDNAGENVKLIERCKSAD